MLLLWPLLCVFCVFNVVYCKDEPSYFAFIISNEEGRMNCSSTIKVYEVKAGQNIEFLIVSPFYINNAIIKKEKSNLQNNTQNKSASQFHVHKLSKYVMMTNDNVDKSLEGNWTISVLMLRDVDDPVYNIVKRDGHNYTEAICSMQISVTDADSLVCKGNCIYIWMSLSVLMCITVIVEACLIFYYVYQAQKIKRYAQLSTVAESNENGDNARYCGTPSQKPIIASDRDLTRESGIYEALETLQISRRPPIPEPPQLETLPRSPKPIPMTILREPLPDPPPIQSSLLRPPTNNTPTSLTMKKNKIPVPTVIEAENTYEAPPNYHGPLPNPPLEPDTKESTFTTIKAEDTKDTLTKKQKAKNNIKVLEKARTSLERIRDRPPMPIPPEVTETQEVYEEMKTSLEVPLLRNAALKNTSSPIASLARNAALKNTSSPTASLARNAAPKGTLSPTASLARNAAPNKPIVSNKPVRPKQLAELKKGSLPRLTKSKPDISQKPNQLNQPDNVANELSNILQKRKDKSSASSTQDTNPNPAKAWLRNQPDNAAEELSNILKKRKETSTGLVKTDGSITPATQYPRKIETPTAVPLRHDASPMAGLSSPIEVPTPETASSAVRSNTKVHIHVEGANYDDDDEEYEDWTYEQLEDFNIYSV